MRLLAVAAALLAFLISPVYAMDSDLPPLDKAPGTPVYACATPTSTQCAISGFVTRYDALGAHYTGCAQVDITTTQGTTTYDVVYYERDHDGDDYGKEKLNTLPQGAYFASIEATLLAAFTSQQPLLGLVAPHDPVCDYPDDVTGVPVRHLTLQRGQVIHD